MLKLYGGARTRASIVQWYLEELGVAYEFVLLDMQAGEHLQPEYLAINPIGKVPAIVDGDLKLWESGAILSYLAQKYGHVSSAPEDLALINQWILFANATLGPGLFVDSKRDREMSRYIDALNKILANQAFLLSDEFTVADVAVGSLLIYSQLMLQLDYQEYPAVQAYIQRIKERPGFQKTIGARS